jgi:hypothetical protein
MYSDSTSYDYYLHSEHSNIPSEISTNFEYALTWLLNNLHFNLTEGFYIEIRKVIDDRETHYIKEGILFWDNGSIVKKLNKSDLYKTSYSPYDMALFNKTTLSHLYCELINKYNSNNTLSQSSTLLPPPITKSVQSSSLPLNNFKQINKILDNTKTSTRVDSDIDTDDESVSSEQLHDLERHLDELMNKKSELVKTLDENKDKLADVIMENNYAKTLKIKKEEKEKEKRNIFISDLSVYKKINKVNNAAPDFFMAKFVVLDYLEKNKFFDGEDLEAPSGELFEIFNILYNSRFTKDFTPPEECEELVMNFIDSLPDVDIITQEQFHDQLNKVSEYSMFSSDLVKN